MLGSTAQGPNSGMLQTHWGNVDSGSMVNICYSGVLTAYPWLRKYSQEFRHVVKGVGENVSRVLCKLADVPLCLGKNAVSGTWLTTTFYVLECPQYHFILGLPLLSCIDAQIRCKPRELVYKLGPGGTGEEAVLKLCTRTEARESTTVQHANEQL